MQPNINSTVSDESPSSGPLNDEEPILPSLFQEEYSSILATAPGHKLDSFYVSLFVNGHKLSNCIIDFGASDNVMPTSIAKALGMTLTKTFGWYYSMDAT